jgi:acyl-CoA thioesterase II
VPHSILELLDLDRTGPGEFRGASADEPDWIYGGQVVGQALAAATATVAADRSAHSLHAHYLRQGKGGAPVDYTVQRLRDGGAFSARQVSAHQDGRLLAVADVSFHTGEEPFGHQAVMPAAPPPDSAPPSAALEVADPGWPYWVARRPDLDLRAVGAPGPRHGESLVWSRVTLGLPDDPRLHACAWAYLSDLTLLAAIRVPYEPEPGVRRRWRMMTLNHAIWFHQPVRADQWLLLHQHSPAASAGRGLSMASVFSADGTLVSSLAQEGVGRPLAQ